MLDIYTAPDRAVDMRIGTGIWAIQFAQMYPASRVIGVDISLIQPENVPANCTFFREVGCGQIEHSKQDTDPAVQDSEDEPWVWDHPFDYIQYLSLHD
jgi:predicted RNA methylase